MTRHATVLSIAYRPLRSLFNEVRGVGMVTWGCRLCHYSYVDSLQADGRPMSADCLYMLVKHLTGHQRG